MSKRLPFIFAAVAVALVFGATMVMNRTTQSANYLPLPGAAIAETPERLIQAQAEGGEDEVDLSRVIEIVEGNPDAPVTIIEFSSFTCPHCARYNQTIYPQMRAEYIDSGRIQYIKREVYFDAYGLWAALVARCGGAMSYSGIANIMYAEQQEWARGADANAVAENLRRIGRRAGLGDDQLNACMTDRDMAVALMETYRQGAEDYGIRATPSFVINGETYSNMSFEEFQGIIDPLLEVASE